ncbi:MAG: ABC transporter ATP-binding protein [Methanosarcinaceae archaeon]|nr:ABC transporter ATP-binding protein [Methanosarcinaceae archaeon]
MGIEVDFKTCYYEKKKNSKNKKNIFTLNAKFQAQNELVVLFGPSGSGKTTLLRCVSGLMDPGDGKIIVNNKLYYDTDKKINLPVQDRKLGYVFQNYALFPHMNVRKNIEYGLKGWDKEAKEEKVCKMLKLMDIYELENRYPSELSGGQSQRVSLARALAPEPDILLLDEPFSALDMVIRIKLREKIKEIQRELQIPILFITHNPEEAFTLADRIVVLHKGEVKQSGTPEEVFHNPKSSYVAELLGLFNIFDDTIVENYNDQSKNSILMSGNMQISTRDISLKSNDRVSLGIRPENIYISNCRVENRDKICSLDMSKYN